MTEALKHIIREAPAWATGPELTECGNRADATTATTRDDWERFVQAECRGSVQRSQLTYCVTCVGTAQRHGKYSMFNPSLIDAALRHLSGKDKRRVIAELEALRLLVSEHRAEYEATVFDLLNLDDLSGRRGRR